MNNEKSGGVGRLRRRRTATAQTTVAKRCSGRGALVLAVAYFVMVWIGKSERREVLRTHIVETAKRIYGAPEFFYYAHPC